MCVCLLDQLAFTVHKISDDLVGYLQSSIISKIYPAYPDIRGVPCCLLPAPLILSQKSQRDPQTLKMTWTLVGYFCSAVQPSPENPILNS